MLLNSRTTGQTDLRNLSLLTSPVDRVLGSPRTSYGTTPAAAAPPRGTGAFRRVKCAEYGLRCRTDCRGVSGVRSAARTGYSPYRRHLREPARAGRRAIRRARQYGGVRRARARADRFTGPCSLPWRLQAAADSGGASARPDSRRAAGDQLRGERYTGGCGVAFSIRLLHASA